MNYDYFDKIVHSSFFYSIISHFLYHLFETKLINKNKIAFCQDKVITKSMIIVYLKMNESCLIKKYHCESRPYIKLELQIYVKWGMYTNMETSFFMERFVFKDLAI